ncbi:NTP transferase domain-containing protein [Jannaschia sp. 2305UL9-9]|uniref:nucleotidyltransferase family protein n=1 Tax=Jannaschia sp. 2305UL9-9 TaxID=3121638 RepID=UPI003529CB53
MRPAPAIVILAAGASSRMRGDDKLLQPVAGTPLILRVVRMACAACADVTVVLPKGDTSRRAWLGDTPARLIEVEAREMSASLRAGVAACTADAMMVVLADMPEVTGDDLWTLITAWRNSTAGILRATGADGTPGQPVIFARSLFAALQDLTGDEGARRLLRDHEVTHVPLPARDALTDLDTPEDWADWRAANPDA